MDIPVREDPTGRIVEVPSRNTLDSGVSRELRWRLGGGTGFPGLNATVRTLDDSLTTVGVGEGF
jgi:hypothetical protein